MKTFFIFLFVISLVGCSVSHNVDHSKIDKIEVAIFDNTHEVESREYGVDSMKLKEFNQWVSENASGWEVYLVSVMPGIAVVSGKGFSLNIGDSWVILNYEHSNGEYRQLTKSIEINEFSFLID